jgi:uncharacterized protein YuzE
MKITFDPRADAVSVRLSDAPIETERPGHAVALDRAAAGGAFVIVHFDGDDFVSSFEILEASIRLRPEVLASALPPDTSDFWARRAVRRDPRRKGTDRRNGPDTE